MIPRKCTFIALVVQMCVCVYAAKSNNENNMKEVRKKY